MLLITDGQPLENDPWHLYVPADNAQGIADYSLLPIDIWAQQGDSLSQSIQPLGAWLSQNDTLDALIPFLAKIDVMCFEFAKFVDGRAFSYAQLLRQQHQYQGDIRACGDFLPDQVHYLLRCGFNVFEFINEQRLNTALKVQDWFNVHYQGDAAGKAALYDVRQTPTSP